jgi:transcriptional regulator with XRE-family HTH domain
MKTLYKANGREIQALRKKKNLTIVDLAKRAGYATRTIKRAENSDTMEITSLRNIADALEVDLEQIADGLSAHIPKEIYPFTTRLSIINLSSDLTSLTKYYLLHEEDREMLPAKYFSYPSEEQLKEKKYKEDIQIKELEWEVLCNVNSNIAELIASTINSCRKYLGLDWDRDNPRYTDDGFQGETANINRLGLIADNIEKLEKEEIFLHGGVYSKYTHVGSREKEPVIKKSKVFRLEFSQKASKTISAHIHRGVYQDLREIERQKVYLKKDMKEPHRLDLEELERMSHIPEEARQEDHKEEEE